VPVEEVADLLCVDLDFGGDWIYTQVPWDEPDLNQLNELDAQTVISYLNHGMVASERSDELDMIAERIDFDSDNDSGSIAERIGLTGEELKLVFDGMRESILEGDSGWDHCAELKIKADNGWQITFKIVYNDVDKNVSFRIEPSPDEERLHDVPAPVLGLRQSKSGAPTNPDIVSNASKINCAGKTPQQAFMNAASGMSLMSDETFLKELEELHPTTPWVQQLRSRMKSSTMNPQPNYPSVGNKFPSINSNASLIRFPPSPSRGPKPWLPNAPR
jgi:hypothetical protein